ncbi:MAG TPA: hypothetical protein VMT29_15000 [Steroidobacteraceae bacterium]|nr:hypothetical protein [Steroidobacteraceae bacterium]
MSTKILVRAITLTIGVALTAMAITLQAYIVSPVLSAEIVTVAEYAGAGDEAEAAAYPIEIPIGSQLCPC